MYVQVQWVSECVWVSECECECVSVSEWVWVSESVWVSEWVWVSECVRAWVNEWVSEWMSEGVNEWMSEWVSDWVSEWVNEWVSESVSEWVSCVFCFCFLCCGLLLMSPPPANVVSARPKPYLPISLSIYLSVKPARPTWTCSLQVKNASQNMAGRQMA